MEIFANRVRGTSPDRCSACLSRACCGRSTSRWARSAATSIRSNGWTSATRHQAGVCSFLAGIVIGGALSALVVGTYRPTLSYGAFTASFGAIPGTGGAVLLVAGTLIGFGARLGGGCTSGHGVCGMAMGSPASIVCTMTFMGAAIAVAHRACPAVGRRHMKIAGLLIGIGFGFVLGWSRLTDYDVIRDMLLLREFDVFLMMGSAVATAAIVARVLRAGGASR